MKIRNKEEFTGKYWNKRWEYLEKVAKYILDINPITILEIGPHDKTLCIESDIMDINEKLNPLYLHNASSIPYPIKNKQYDMVIALQVWEHLNNQLLAFKEVKRIANYAVLSFPYLWKHPHKDNCHYNITKEIINEWTNNENFLEELIIGNPKRLIRFYKF